MAHDAPDSGGEIPKREAGGDRPAPSTPRWLGSARWFGAEFLVVVTGVLVALAVQAWYEGRREGVRERIYLHQLASDLRETERLMLAADSASRLGEHSVTMLVRSFNTTSPPHDSVLTWLAGIGGVSYQLPITGTAEALVAGGDLGLIRSDSLRAAIPAYVTQTRASMELFAQATDRWYQLRAQLRASVEPFDAAVLGNVPRRPRDVRGNPIFDPRPGGEDFVAFPIDVAAVLGDRRTYGILSEMNTQRSLLWTIRAEMRSDARALAELIARRGR